MTSRLIRPLAAALLVGFVALPSLAFAEGKAKPGKQEFPVAGSIFVDNVDKKIVKLETRIKRGLAKHDVPAERQREILAAVEAGTTKIRNAANQAAADGTVTREEAKEVRKVVRELRRAAKAKYGEAAKGKRDAKAGKRERGAKADNAQNRQRKQ